MIENMKVMWTGEVSGTNCESIPCIKIPHLSFLICVIGMVKS